jgi:hypothetical protein
MKNLNNHSNSFESSTVLDSSKLITFRTLPAVAGFYWVYRGWLLFINKPWAILFAVTTLYAINLTLAVIPLIGPILSFILNPALHLGLIGIIAVRIAPTQESKLKQLLAVFYHPKILNKMLRLGCTYSASIIISMLLSMGLAGSDFLDMQQKIVDNTANINDAAVQAIMIGGLMYIIPTMLLVVLLFWFTNQLVGWHGQSIRKALFFNIMAIWRNRLAFIVYITSCFAISVGLVLLTTLLPADINIRVLTLPAILVFISWFLCSIYATYESMVQIIE